MLHLRFCGLKGLFFRALHLPLETGVKFERRNFEKSKNPSEHLFDGCQRDCFLFYVDINNLVPGEALCDSASFGQQMFSAYDLSALRLRGRKFCNLQANTE